MMRTAGWVFGALVLALSGCRKEPEVAGPVDAGPKQLAEAEPNDRPDKALAILESSEVSAGLSADPNRPDEDWYKLSAVEQSVDVAVSGAPGVDVVLEVMDVDGNRLALVNGAGEGAGERLPNLALRGVAYLRVSSAKRGVGGAYSLAVRFFPPAVDAEAEPNDRAADSTLLELGRSASGLLGHAADEDWYRVELAPEVDAKVEVAGGPLDAGELNVGADAGVDAGVLAVEEKRLALRVELSAVSGVRFELSVLSVAEAPLFVVKGAEGEGLSLRNVGVREADRVVYVVVKSAAVGVGKDAKRGFNAELPYSLSVSQEEAGANAEYEPNDELAKATSLPLQGFKEGFLSPKSDLDYFVLRSAEPVLARVQLSGVERLDLVLSVIQPVEGGEPKVVMKVNDGAVKEPEVLNDLRCAPECWLRVEGNTRKVDGKWVRDFENRELPYRLSVSTVPDDGSQEREPNGTVELATELTLAKPIRGTVQPKKDADYFRLDLSARPVKTPLRATLTGILKVDVGLYLHRVEADGKLSLVQTADRAKGEAPEVIRYAAEPGVYVFEVRDSKGRESNFQDAYQLTVEEDE